MNRLQSSRSSRLATAGGNEWHENVKAISGKLTIGAGRPSGSWLMLLLLLAVLVPSVCLLWFMNQAVHNERLAVRQKLADAYRVNLSLVQNQLEAYWRQTAAALDAEADRLSPPGALCEASPRRPGRCRDLLRCRRQRRLSGPGSGAQPEAPEAAWTEAERLESSNPAEAAAAFARLAEQATNADLAARALQAQARCLVKAGKTNEAIAVLTGPLEEERYRHATDAQGRLLVPNAELMALELLKDSAPDRARVPLERLKQRVLDYDDPALSAPQRRFLMREAAAAVSRPGRGPDAGGGRPGGALPRSRPGYAPASRCCAPRPCRAYGNLRPPTGGW